MEGPIPDPGTLDADGDDDVPLSLVKEKHNIERTASQRMSGSQVSAPPPGGPSQVRRAPQQDLFGDDDIAPPPPRANSAAPVASGPPPKSEPTPPKQTKPADSLLGLDFFGEAQAPARPSSAAPTPGAQSRPDLKQSILSLYASAPRPQPQQQPSHASSGSFGGIQSPPPPQQQAQSSFGGMNDAFSGLSFSSKSTSPTMQSQPPKQSAFSNLGNLTSHSRGSSQVNSPPPLSGGSFFDTKPAQKSPPPQPSRGFSSSSGFGAFDSAPGMSPTPASNAAASSGLGDLFDFSIPAAPPAPPKQTIASPPISSPTAQHSSVFNLSQPAPPPKPQQPVASTNDWSNSDAWGSNDAWSTAKASPTVTKAAPAQTSSGGFGGWGSGGSLANQSIVPGGGGGFTPASHAQPKVSPDEDFGGWSSAAPVTPGAGTAQPKPATGFAASEDLFSNVWE
jgi:stromal membrane-associated protein